MLVRIITWIVLVMWALIGFALWIPFLTRMIVTFMGAIIASMYRQSDPAVARHGLEMAMTFYPRGFKMIMDSMHTGGKRRPATTTTNDTLALRTIAIEGGLAVLFWVLIGVSWKVFIATGTATVGAYFQPAVAEQPPARTFMCAIAECSEGEYVAYLADREASLKSREGEIRESEIQTQSALLKREREVDAKDSAVEERDGAITAKEIAMEARERSVKEREFEVVKRLAGIDAREQKIDAIEADVKKRVQETRKPKVDRRYLFSDPDISSLGERQQMIQQKFRGGLIPSDCEARHSVFSLRNMGCVD